MLKHDDIIRLVRDAGTANFPPETVQDVLVEPAIDSQGEDALRITIVIPPGTAAKLGGEAALNTLVQVQDRLLDAGDERFPILEYATHEELEDVGDPES